MTIKIAYRLEKRDFGQVHIAELVTPSGDQRMAQTPQIDRLQDALVNAHLKRSTLRNLLDDAIHLGFL